MTWRVFCEGAELAVQCLHGAQQLGLELTPEVAAHPIAATLADKSREPAAMLVLTAPSVADLVELAAHARDRGAPIALALLAPDRTRPMLLDVAGDLGITATSELRPLLALLALLEAGAHDAFAATGRNLAPADRVRLKPALAQPAKHAGALVAGDGARIAYCATADTPARVLGETPDVVEALLALRRVDRAAPRITSSVDGVDERAVLDVLFGPRRSLSDPASKAALSPYGLPMPLEELCASPSRAAAEATRMGYPVRVSLASPDLRIWDHPDLSVDMVDNAARVRDTFRQILAVAHARIGADARLAAGAEQRVLGVVVTATSEPVALLSVRATALPRARVAMELGFADPHGRAAQDATMVVMPADMPTTERALRRLAGGSLLLQAPSSQRKARLESIHDVLLRLAAFVNDRRADVEAVEIRPLAVLMDGSAEVREACVAVSDCFERTLGLAQGA